LPFFIASKFTKNAIFLPLHELNKMLKIMIKMGSILGQGTDDFVGSNPSIVAEFHETMGCRFHQHFTRSFYAQRSQKPKKILLT